MTPESVDPAVIDKTFVGSCVIFEAENIDIVRKLVEEDVYYKSNVVCVLASTVTNIWRAEIHDAVGQGQTCHSPDCIGNGPSACSFLIMRYGAPIL
jgi:hypothetical protein